MVSAKKDENIIQRRNTAVYFESFTDCNPNGAFEDGMPRCEVLPDGSTIGIMSDVCQKRFCRDTIPVIAEDPKRFGIYIERMKYLIDKHREATGGKTTQGDDKLAATAQSYMLARYIDIRLFGGVLNVGKEAETKDAAKFFIDNVRGPVRVGYARTIHPVLIVEEAMTRVVATKPKKRKKDDSIVSVGNAEVGSTSRIGYGMYRSLICVNPEIAKQSKMTNADLELFYKSLVLWPQVTHSRSRHGRIHRLFVFEHPTTFGTAQDYDLQDLVASLTKVSKTVASDNDIQLPTLAEVKKALAERQKRGLMKGITVRDVVKETYESSVQEAT